MADQTQRKSDKLTADDHGPSYDVIATCAEGNVHVCWSPAIHYVSIRGAYRDEAGTTNSTPDCANRGSKCVIASELGYRLSVESFFVLLQFLLHLLALLNARLGVQTETDTSL